MKYLGIIRKGIMNFMDVCSNNYTIKTTNRSGVDVKKKGQRNFTLMIHGSTLEKRPDNLGIRTIQALKNGVLREYTAEEAVKYLKDKGISEDVVKRTLTEEDYEIYTNVVKSTKSRKRSKKKAKMIVPLKVDDEPTTKTTDTGIETEQQAILFKEKEEKAFTE